MTKQEIVHYLLTVDTKDLGDRLDKLMDEERITSGARYLVYNPMDSYDITWLLETLGKASDSKNYTRYLKRISLGVFEYHLNHYNKHLADIEAFVEEQENLPFDQTQKQVLIQKGELR